MKTKELIVNFRYVFGNIACMSVSSTTGKPVENDINNEDAIKMFNALIGEKENSIIQENHQLKDRIEKAIKLIEDEYYSLNTTNIDSIVVSTNKFIQVRKILKGEENK